MCLMSQVEKLSRAKYSSDVITGIVGSLVELTGQDLFEGQAPHVADEKEVGQVNPAQVSRRLYLLDVWIKRAIVGSQFDHAVL